jgi:hypothetical protein
MEKEGHHYTVLESLLHVLGSETFTGSCSHFLRQIKLGAFGECRKTEIQYHPKFTIPLDHTRMYFHEAFGLPIGMELLKP